MAKHKSFIVVPNEIFKDKKISLKAKGMYALFYSLPDNFDFSIENISMICKESKDAISSGMKELENNGYLKRDYYRNEKGYPRVEYTLFEKKNEVF